MSTVIKKTLSHSITLEWRKYVFDSLWRDDAYTDKDGTMHNVAIVPAGMFNPSFIRENKSWTAMLYFSYKPGTAFNLPESKIEAEVPNDCREYMNDNSGKAYYTRSLISISTDYEPVEHIKFVVKDLVGDTWILTKLKSIFKLIFNS